MQFTYDAYEKLICTLHENGYQIRGYHDYCALKKCAILRHDIDYDLRRAVAFSEIEKRCNAKSTYFVLLTSDFYNLASKSSMMVLDKLRKNGHEIGLHFDEVQYLREENKWNREEMIDNIIREVDLLSKIIDEPVRTVSMHRPSKETLESNLEIPGIINSYSDQFFNDFKYVSDSRMRWRENVNEIINTSFYDRLHILTHPFWYGYKESQINEIICAFIESAKNDRICMLDNNITDLDTIIGI